MAMGLVDGLDGEGRNRTGDTTIFSRVLYQLSYLAARRDGSRGAYLRLSRKFPARDTLSWVQCRTGGLP